MVRRRGPGRRPWTRLDRAELRSGRDAASPGLGFSAVVSDSATLARGPVAHNGWPGLTLCARPVTFQAKTGVVTPVDAETR